jgi:uncharacterized protein YdcH (DUF465 family)
MGNRSKITALAAVAAAAAVGLTYVTRQSETPAVATTHPQRASAPAPRAEAVVTALRSARATPAELEAASASWERDELRGLYEELEGEKRSFDEQFADHEQLKHDIAQLAADPNVAVSVIAERRARLDEMLLELQAASERINELTRAFIALYQETEIPRALAAARGEM